MKSIINKTKRHLINPVLLLLLVLCPAETLISAPVVKDKSDNLLLFGKNRKDIGINFDIGINGSGDYKTVIKDHFSGDDISGGLLWLSLGIGLDFRVINNLFIEPRITWLSNRVSVPSLLSGYNNDRTNTVFLPGIGAKYYLFLIKEDSPDSKYFNIGMYVDGRIYKTKPDTEITDLTFTSGGMGKNLAAGMHLGVGIGALNIEIGKRWIPVTVNGDNISKDFGGFYAEVSGIFYLFNYSGIKNKLLK